MTKPTVLWLLLASLSTMMSVVVRGADFGSGVRSVPALDLTRYAGTWYEVARYPNWFQRQCAGDVTAEYTLGPSDRIGVVNKCRKKDGSVARAEGTARKATPEGPDSQLKVRFAPAFLSFIPAVWGDYWVLGLGPDYSYAVVGDPSRKYVWILSRTSACFPRDAEGWPSGRWRS